MGSDQRGHAADTLSLPAYPAAENGAGDRRSREVDDLDKRIAVALQVSPRAQWRQVAGMVGTSESTARRHAERMLQAGLLRSTVVEDPGGRSFPMLVQFTCELHRATDVARRLAERDDVRFVSLVTGRFDVVAELLVRSYDALAGIILEEFPAIPGIIRTTTETVLHNFKTSYDWGRDLLGPAEDNVEVTPHPQPTPARPFSFDAIDLQLIRCLKQNGRMSYADLATLCSISEPMARRRVEALFSSGSVRAATFVNPHLLGYDVEILVWLRVELSQLEQIAVALATRREVRYLSATSGFSDLVCEIILPTHAHLYAFLTTVLGTLPGIRQVDTATELLTMKRAFVRLDDETSSGEQ